MIGRLTFLGVVLVLVVAAVAYVSDPSIDAGVDVVTPTATPATTPTPGAEPSGDEAEETPAEEEPTPATPVANREDCNAIRGTSYYSPEERDWFLANCVQR